MPKRIHPRPPPHMVSTLQEADSVLYLGRLLNHRQVFAGLKSSMPYSKKVLLLLELRLERHPAPVLNPRLQ